MKAKEFLHIIRRGKAARKEPITQEEFEANRLEIQKEILMAGNLIWRGGIQPILQDIREIMREEVRIIEAYMQDTFSDLDQEQDDDIIPIWLVAMSTAFVTHQQRVVDRLTPRLQSIQSQTYSRLTSLMGGQQSEFSLAILNSARSQAQQFGVAGTARSRTENAIRRSVQAGESIQRTIDRLFEEIDSISNAYTIAHTEANTAGSRGAALAFADSNVHLVGVFGCAFLEADYTVVVRGERIFTCNARNLLPSELATMRFHINHQGFPSPMSFRRSDGLLPETPRPTNGPGIIR